VNVNLPSFLLEKSGAPEIAAGKGHIRYAYLDRGIAGISSMIQTCFFNGAFLSRGGWLQKIDARIKVALLALLIAVISIKTRLIAELAISAFLMILVVLSRLDVTRFYARVLKYTFLFGLVVTFPALFNVITPGEIIFPVIELERSQEWWLYQIPQQIGITSQGLQAVSMLNLRVLNSMATASLIMHTTPFGDMMKALRVFRIPDALLLIVTLSHKYIFILAKTIDDMFLARKSRLAGSVHDREARAWIAGRMGHLFRKSRMKYEEIFRAMEARGFCDEVRFPAFDRLDNLSRMSGCLFLLAGLFLLWI